MKIIKLILIILFIMAGVNAYIYYEIDKTKSPNILNFETPKFPIYFLFTQKMDLDNVIMLKDNKEIFKIEKMTIDLDYKDFLNHNMKGFNGKIKFKDLTTLIDEAKNIPAVLNVITMLSIQYEQEDYIYFSFHSKHIYINNKLDIDSHYKIDNLADIKVRLTLEDFLLEDYNNINMQDNSNVNYALLINENFKKTKLKRVEIDIKDKNITTLINKRTLDIIEKEMEQVKLEDVLKQYGISVDKFGLKLPNVKNTADKIANTLNVNEDKKLEYVQKLIIADLNKKMNNTHFNDMLTQEMINLFENKEFYFRIEPAQAKPIFDIYQDIYNNEIFYIYNKK